MTDRPQSAPVAWILGAGTSGAAAARLLAARGCAVRVFDEAEGGRAADALEAEGIPVARRAMSLPAPDSGAPAPLVVASPGLGPESPLRRSAVALGLDVRSELDAALPYLRCRAIAAVTGSKGKSSLVKLLADALSLGGRPAVPCGNYGTALAEVAMREPPPDVAVVECSSFQLETTRDLRPDVGVFLNLSPDHLARHGGMDGYRDAKLRLFQRQTPAETALLPASESGQRLLARYRELGLRGRVETFGIEPEADWRWEPGSVRGPRGARLAIAGSYFDNAVLGPAAAAGAAALAALGLAPDVAAAALRGFEPLPHRMQLVRTLGGVRYVNDSKATSLTALRAGVQMAGGPVRLIAGGRLKEKELGDGKFLLANGVRMVYLIGESAGILSSAWCDGVPTTICGTLERAVAQAAAEARDGETVLLSPGTASFDQFHSFEERGDRFAELVRNL